MNYNKLKRTAEKITMPEDMKERMIKNCQAHAAQDNIDTDADFAHQVSGVETKHPRHIARIISAAAACAVIAGSVGTAAHFMKRSAPETNNLTGEISEIEVSNNPLADFNDHDYIFSDSSAKIQAGLNKDQKSLFASYFSQCEYGEWTDEDETAAMSRSSYESYNFISTSETESISITIDCNDCLTITRYNGNIRAHNVGESQPLESTVSEKYKIDYEDFQNTVNLIMSVEATGKIAPFGDLNEFDFEIIDVLFGDHSQSIPITVEQKSRIADFLNSADYAEWTYEDDASAAVSSYPSYEQYHLQGIKAIIDSNDTFYCDIAFDITGCLTVTQQQYSASKNHEATDRYKMDYNLFKEAFQQITDVDVNAYMDIGDEPFVDFESYIQNGAEIKYTLSDIPMHDLTEDQCKLLDDYFLNIFNKLEEVEEAEEHVANAYPVIIFEIRPTDLKSLFIQIYSDDYILLRDDNTPYAKWYKYNGDRMYAEIETVFRNGSTVDNAGFYPPFGNLAKSGGTYTIRQRNSMEVITVDGDLLHQLFYGYDWDACKIDNSADIPAADSPSFHLSFEYNDSYTNNIYIYPDGQIDWYINNSLTNMIIEEHRYQLTDTRVWDELSKPFTEMYGYSSPDNEPT